MGRLSYAGIPYANLQQGTKDAPNPDNLNVMVHLATMELRLSAPTQTELVLQLPSGRLRTTSVIGERVDSNIGDAEFRIRQTLPWARSFQVQTSLGMVLPTGPYVPRSGAANLPPEASFLTLGRGIPWAIAELQSSHRIADKTSAFAQLTGRLPIGNTEDDFSWGSELRTALGAQYQLISKLSALAILEHQYRGKATEPDPFQGGRIESANAGGHWWTASPALSYQFSAEIDLLAGARIPFYNDVVGNQLVPSIGGFVALSGRFSRGGSESSAAPKAASEEKWQPPTPVPGKITIVDYWASWCAPCKDIAAALEKAELSWTDVEIIKVNCTEWPDNGVVVPGELQALPVVEIYDRNASLAHRLTGEEALKTVDYVERLRKGAPQP